ncbi:MAG: zf-HC2 domain-containing protein [Proteobacteria bacterium]|nr:zf-HC2 domain-containing protein [Pseudomonadota bacterium]
MQALLPDYVGGRLDAALKIQLDDHVEHCLAACPQHLLERRELEDLRPFYRFTAPPEKPAEFWRQYLSDCQAGAAEIDAGRVRTSAQRWGVRWVRRHVWAVSCATVILAATTLWWGGGETITPGAANVEYADALEFYFDQHYNAIANETLMQQFPARKRNQSIQFVGVVGR